MCNNRHDVNYIVKIVIFAENLHNNFEKQKNNER